MLVVNDQESQRRYLRLHLEMQGYQVGVAEDGVVALECLRARRYDVILLDLRMPRMDGFAVLEALQADEALRNLPVIIVSASDDRAHVIRCIEMGATDYLTQPVDPLLLKARVGASLAWQQLRQTELDYLRCLHELTRSVDALKSREFDPRKLDEMARRTDPIGDLARLFQELGQEVFLRGQSREQEMSSLREELQRLQAEGGTSLSGRILVVDDEATSRKMLSLYLSQHGYEVEMAESGQQALELLGVRAYDIVLLDLLMPGMDGFQVLEVLKGDAHLRDIPVIVVSAVEDAEGIARLIEMGAHDHLSKPFNAQLLTARVRACLVGKRARDQELAFLRGVTTLTQAAVAMEGEDFDPDSLNEVARRSDAVGRLARVFQEMSREIVARQRQLKLQVGQLQEELEQARLRAQRSQATQTDFVQNLNPQSLQTGEAKVVVFCSFRGGVGKSEAVANLGVLLASAGFKVGLLDANLQAPGLHLALALTLNEQNTSLQDLLSEQSEGKSVCEIRVPGEGQLLLVPGSTHLPKMARLLRQGYSPQVFTQGLKDLSQELKLDFLLVDTQAGLNEEMLLGLLLCRQAVVVTRDHPREFEGVGALIQVAERLKVGNLSLLVSASPEPNPLEALETTFQLPLLGVLPYAVELVQSRSEVFAQSQPDHSYTSALRQVVVKLVSS
ncbi:MAG: response regulator [Vulcanimicrobiota bacterium]